VRIEKWVYGGNGIAWADEKTHFVGFVLPGEKVKVEGEPDRRGVYWDRPLEILEPSPDRVVPKCPHFGACGGCQYQHTRYERQLELKAEILIEQLARMGRITYERDVDVISGPEYGYRNRCQFQITNGKLGYFEQGSNDLVPIRECPIASPGIFSALEKIRPILPKIVSRFELFTNEQEVQLNLLKTDKPVAKRFFEECAKVVPGTDQPHLDYPVGSDVFRVHHKSFFQVNRFLIEELIKAVLDGAEGTSVFDLYSGGGLFSVPLARKFADVTSVEVGNSAFGDLQFNLQRAGLKAKTINNRAEDWLTGVHKTPDLIVADPPRTGLGKVAVKELLRLKAPQLTIISCNPSTLARDMEELKAVYDIADLTLVDLFPQTYHMETIAKLRIR
jgi:23S rRNA (uracil1939-C5)-methyltransferase